MKRGNGKTEILNSAKKLFGTYGYEGTSISMVANAVGVQKSAIYAHYDGKKDLFLAVFQQVHNDLQSMIEKIDEESSLSAVQKLEKIFYGLSMHESVNIYRFGLHPLPEFNEKSNDIFLKYENWFRDILKSLFSQAREAGDMMQGNDQDLIEGFMYLNNGVMLKCMNYPLKEYPAKVDLAWKIFIEWAQIS